MCSTCSFAARPLLWGRCLSCFEHILRSCCNASYPFAWFQAEVVVCTVWGSMIPPGTGDNCTGHCLARNSAPATKWGGDDGGTLPTSGRPGNGEGVSSAQGRWGVPHSRTVRMTLQLSFKNFDDVFRETMFSFVPFSLSQVKFPVISTPVNEWKEFVLSTSLFLYTVYLQNVLSMLSFSVFWPYCLLHFSTIVSYS